MMMMMILSYFAAIFRLLLYLSVACISHDLAIYYSAICLSCLVRSQYQVDL